MYQILAGLDVACPAYNQKVWGSSSGDGKDLFAFLHQKWREIQTVYVQLETRSILMGKNKMASVQDTCPRL